MRALLDLAVGALQGVDFERLQLRYQHVLCAPLRDQWYTFLHFVFFFKQKTAYEITYGDWSSDVCSSDLFVDDGEIIGTLLFWQIGAPASDCVEEFSPMIASALSLVDRKSTRLNSSHR